MIMKKFTAILLAMCFAFSSLLCCFAATETDEVEAYAAQDEKTIYLKAGATGDGTSIDSPVGSFVTACQLAAAETVDVKIQVIGEIGFNYAGGPWVFPAHTNKITFSGYGTRGKFNMNTENGGGAIWYLMGDVQIEYIEMNLSPYRLYIITQFHNLYMMDGITMSSGSNKFGILATNGGDISSKWDGTKYVGDSEIVLRSGVYDAVAIGAQNGTKGHVDGHVRLTVQGKAEIWDLHVARDANGATVRDVTVILDGGKIQTLTSYQNKGTDFGVTGTYKVIVTEKFNVAGSFTQHVWGDNIWYGISGVTFWSGCEWIIDSENVGDYLVEIEEGVYDAVLPYVKESTFTAGGITKIASGAGLAGEDFIPDYEDGLEAQPNTVYVKNNGNGDGLTPQTPTGNFITAMQLAAAMEGDATIQVIGEIFWVFGKTAFYSPAHTNKIRITGEGTYGKINADTTNGGSSIWYLSGDTQIDNIEFSLKPWRMYIITRLHDFYALEGITMANGSNKIELMGVLNDADHAFDGVAYNANYEIVLLSGIYDWVAPFAENSNPAVDLMGEVNFTFGGTAEAWLLCAAVGTASSASKVNFYLDGGIIHTMTAFTNATGATVATGVAYAIDEFNITVTENFDVSKSFTQRPWEGDLTYGISGASIYGDANVAIESGIVGSYNLKVEEGVYENVMEYVNWSSFTSIEMIASGSGLPSDEPEAVYGDVNGDGGFNNTDITELVRYLSGWDVSDFVYENADVDGNGKVNNRDAFALIVALADIER